MIQKVKKIALALVALLTLSVGCTPKEKNVCHVDPLNWSKGANIVYENNNTEALYNIYFFVRCNADFDLKTMPVIIRVTSPDSSISIDRAFWAFDEEKAPTPTGTIQKIGYRSTCLLNMPGKYTFTLMPMEPIRGVEAVGLTMEETTIYGKR